MTAADGPARLRPLPDSAGRCPLCGGPLGVARVHLPGWRSLLEGTCGSCRHRFVQDLPAGHGLVYPGTLDLDTGRVHAGEHGWFSEWLTENWSAPSDRAVELTIDGPGVRKPATLLNCVDPVYGHALLKLLNADRHLADTARDLVVLVPRALAHLVPVGAAERWVLEAPPSLASEWLLGVDARLNAELDRLADCVLSPAYPHPHPSTWNLETFTGDVPAAPTGRPSVVFAFRDDRPWGTDPASERENVMTLWALLRERWREAGATMIGVGTPGDAPEGIEDRRVERPRLEDERAWMAACRGADIVIGVHGSHLLLPSGLARHALELTPAHRHGNVLQATLIREPDPVMALWRYRQILGDRDLADVTPERVAAVAGEMVDGAERFQALMTGAAAGMPGEVVGTLPRASGGSERSSRSAAGRTVIRPSEIATGVSRRLGRTAGRARARAAQRRSLWKAPKAPAVLTDRRGHRFELMTDDEVRTFVLNRGHFERDELDLLAERDLQGVSIDIGANVGAFTTVLARAAGARGHVHAFEPLARTRERLCRTLELNAIPNVTVHDAAVSDTNGSAEIRSYGPGYESWTSLTRDAIETSAATLAPAERCTVRTVTLDTFCSEHAIDRVAALKVDVEGAEGRVLSGAQGLLAEQRVRLILIELSDPTLEDDGWTAGDITRVLEGHGYRTYTVQRGALTPFRVAGRVEFANVVALPIES